ncbi:MAG: hypothetical protein KME57_23315 [Scytonema hyalinum WJT4-NPBG1]|jgi:hypothetical protein|nr:hypothetical protein [Scytonema hyalinum WJT4-NPBG1]
MEIFVQVLLGVLFVAVGVVLIFWNKILEWVSDNFLPWFEKNFSYELGYKVRLAFAALEKVATPIHGKIKVYWKNFTDIKEAWQTLSKSLLRLLVQFERNARNEWIKRITYWVTRYIRSKQKTSAFKEDIVGFDSSQIRTPESNKPEVVRVVAEEKIDFSQLPPDVRQEWLKRGNSNISQDLDVTQLRDRELELAMTNSN